MAANGRSTAVRDCLLVCVFLLLYGDRSLAWHLLSNSRFHCWSKNASAVQPTPYSSCDGVDIDWLVPPPDSIKAERSFITTYSLVVDPSFYTWAVGKGIFDTAGTTGGFVNDAAGAKTWCETTVCPQDVSTADETNCCVHHVNIHSCPLAMTSVVNNGLCGPWIPPVGSIFTHSQVMAGSITVTNWTSEILGFYELGMTSVIAHFKVAGMHIAIEKEVDVLPKTVCGDDLCESDDGEACDTCPSDCGTCPLNDGEISGIVVSILLVVVAIAVAVGYLQYQRRKLLWDESWIIPSDDITEANLETGQFGSRVSMMSGSTTLSTGASSGMASSAVRRQLFATVAFVDGRQVAVKKVNNNNFHLTKQIRVEVRTVRSLEHPNLCRFMGGCIESGNVSVLYEYCPKGSLLDVLLNDSIPLNWNFRFSLLTDVARGMSYLHRHGMVHGNLKTNNCVVDDRWTCKVTDFGLHEYKRENLELNPDALEAGKRKEMVNQVYRAPETRSTFGTTIPAIPASDVYSFAVILVEVANRDDAYGTEDPALVPEDWKPPLPQYSSDNSNEDPDYVCPSPAEFTKLIERCWTLRPEDRPSIDGAKKTLQQINPNKLSAVDMMMGIMEKYSKHLESIVGERTQQLMEEKQRTDTLLYSMMPRKVADRLKTGEVVKAEQFEACTIYFSDIVGFTDISGRSSPFQVVDLLNKLYCTFDEIIGRHEVYKVETIGDAYMVVSGVPERTQDHARQVALMSLDLVAASQAFSIPHMPGEPLKIRVGLHSASCSLCQQIVLNSKLAFCACDRENFLVWNHHHIRCSVCAGVVGLKMPRYCLFGDTVNTASRMESNGEAYKIHISEFTYKELENLGHFVCEERGSIAVKGKGNMVTYWLVGTDGVQSEKTTTTGCENNLPLTTEKKVKTTDQLDLIIEELILNKGDNNNLDKDPSLH